MDSCDCRREDGRVAEREGQQRPTEEAKPEGIEVWRERPKEGLEISIEHPSFRDLPGQIELATEVNEGIGPLAPAPCQQSRECNRVDRNDG